MVITQFTLAQIVAQASSLSERLRIESLTPDVTQVNEAQRADRILTRWCEVVAQGNWEKFQKRLLWDGLEVAQVSRVLRSHPTIGDRTLPTWAETLKQIIQTAHSFVNHQPQKTNQPLPIDKNNPILFAEILLPALLVARQKLLTRLGFTSLSPDNLPLELLSESAYLTLERSLLDQLLNLSGKTLEYEFTRYRPLGQTILNVLAQSSTDKAQIKVQYEAFVQKLLQDGLLTFFQTYPVLGRLMAVAIDFWGEATAAFLQSLKADLLEIKKIFQPQQRNEEKLRITNDELGKVIEIKSSLSDPHNGGTSVIAITFECGLKLVYKPKDLGAEAAYTQFLGWCDRQDIPLPFKVLKVCDRKTYGWVEYVEHLPCENEAAAQRFYHRAGMLLCLLYALRVVDCHRENLIANGEHLVLIDMETLMHQEVNLIAELPEATAAEASVTLQFSESVLRTGLLPRWEFAKNNRLAYDVSALGGIDEQLIAKEQNQDKVPNTQNPVPTNVPTLNGIPLSPNDYLDKIVSGFEQMYRFLIERREVLLAQDSPLAALKNKRSRFIFRATRIYWTILQKIQSPKFLRDGVDRSIELDILSRAFLVAPKKPDSWPIFNAELKAMEQLDIPYFAAYPNSNNLTIGLQKPIEHYFQEPSYQQVLTQIQTLNEKDLAQQIEIIKGSFYARLVPNKKSDRITNIADFGQIQPLSSQQLLEEATRIATEIQKRAIWGNDGSVKWISFAYIPNAERFQMMPLPEDFYNGNCGIALFLAALDYVKGNHQFRDLILGALQSIRKFLRTADFESTRRFVRCGIGGATGLGSMIYTLVRTSHFLGEASLLEDALGIANLITAELITSDRQFDTLGGSAGAILGLLALYAKIKEPKVLERAIICGQHLLEHQISINGATKAWKILGKKAYTGFSHGAAGIAYALLRLYAVTQNKAYLEAACEGIAYEQSVFSPVAANWPDLRDFAQQNGQPGFMVSWCHGAAGIGLARMGGLSILATDQIYQDVEIALQTTQKHSLHDADCVCCGNFGRIEMLLVAAQKLSRSELREAAEKRAAWGVLRAEQVGGYQFPNLPNSVFSPSFFQGTSGIGYELLRLAHSEVLPSLLLWE
ncbi:type 2 lanthipeptide synthetase LanM family protein [Argonema galeatum]|uniref:type 2 lanthipeptide synthetase LanM family protein n=1 Tax=Argonema galeatum TaxID=2942762 RepID=UPI002012A12F|nr:type 2 lanthipeptide synthetase LanM family protein [Argonema galeatum]MCL1467487.1 type 2 lantipeptide synthetase LanM family protein [Argonema galeatum A003/A1]